MYAYLQKNFRAWHLSRRVNASTKALELASSEARSPLMMISRSSEAAISGAQREACNPHEQEVDGRKNAEEIDAQQAKQALVTALASILSALSIINVSAIWAFERIPTHVSSGDCTT